jgi:hypothetical protein
VKGLALVLLLVVLGVVLSVPALWIVGSSLVGAWFAFWLCVGIRYKKIIRLLVAIDGSRVAAGKDSAFVVVNNYSQGEHAQ